MIDSRQAAFDAVCAISRPGLSNDPGNVLDLDMLLLLVLPRRSEPFQIGPVPHISDADIESRHFHYWEEA